MNFSCLRAMSIVLLVLSSMSGQTVAPPRVARSSFSNQGISSSSSGTVRGTIKDDSGAVIPGAAITLTDSNGAARNATSGSDGGYSFRGVSPGIYTVSAVFKGLQQKGVTAISVSPAQQVLGNIVMTVQTQKQEVTVTSDTSNTISTEAANNASALVLKKEDLDALPDDPDDLEADLTALAGPSAGPGGNQIYIDGFTGGRLPPKNSIREIRINSNPFSAEFDKLGYGRIQIFTKPGSDKFHGQGYYTISDGVWNSRNPFLSDNPPFRTQLFGGNVSGPLGKKASFFVDVERRNIDDNGIITATIPSQDFLSHFSYQNYFPTPQRRTTVSPRVDYQLTANNTLSFRYNYLESDKLVAGIGAFDLPATTIGNVNFPSSGYSSFTNEQGAQIVDTAVLGPRVVNETHFQFDRENLSETSQSLAPGLFVSQSFVSGGSGYSSPGYPSSYDTQTGYELQNYTSVTWGAHTTKFGIRIRADNLEDSSPKNFNGEYQFLGGTFPALDQNSNAIPNATVQLTSIDQYLQTAQLLMSGKTSQQVTGLGYGPSRYTVSAGNPYLSFYQLDFGPFVQDDWKVRPNLTLSLGLRWEDQNNIDDKSNWAPRFGFAWSPDAKRSGGKAKTVIRGGWGYFYDRFAITNVESAYRYNQSNQFVYTINNPQIYDLGFDTPYPLNALSAESSNAAQRYQIDSNLKAPRLMQTAVSVERQLFSHTTLNVNYVNSRGTHELRTVDINAPYPTPGYLPPGAPSFVGGPVSPGVRPYGNVGDIYNYESDGIFKQTQVIVGVNSQVGRWLRLFSRYSYADAHSDTDGIGTIPADPYNFAADWGRSALNIQHSLFMGGSMSTRWGLRFSPFLVAHTGIPYNITTGNDLFLQGQGAATARPEVVQDATPYSIANPFGTGFLNPYPLVAAPGTSNLIERNSASAPGFFGLNLRVSKTFGFGTTKFSGPSGGARAGGHGGGGHHGFDDATTEHRYNLTLSVSARNILNHENLNTPNGAMISPYFTESTGITGGYGAESTASNQRRIDLQLRFSF